MDAASDDRDVTGGYSTDKSAGTATTLFNNNNNNNDNDKTTNDIGRTDDDTSWTADPEKAAAVNTTTNTTTNTNTNNNHHHHHQNATSSPYRGAGTPSSPYIIEFLPHDPGNPRNFPQTTKWLYVVLSTISVLAVTMTSAAYSGSRAQLMSSSSSLSLSSEEFAAGIALYVLGFAVGPCLWAPLSELYGRRIWFVISQGCAAAFVAGTAGVSNKAGLLVLRFLSGMFSASPLTNSGGLIADLFPPLEFGSAMALFSSGPFIGPVLGPVIAGFVSENVGWRWVQGIMAIFVGVCWLVGSVVLKETYGPVLLAWKADKLTKEDAEGRVYKSVIEVERGSSATPRQVFSRALKRPWALLFLEPIVLMASAYLSILYATVYMFLGAFPVVYQELRGWDEGIGGLAFLGMMVGMICGMVWMVLDAQRYRKNGPGQPPEARLPSACVGAITVPIGMFAFAWTNYPSIHWAASIILSSLFGFGMVLVFVSVLTYLVDAYLIYAASALAATAMMRSFFGTAFPLFTSQLYHGLGVHWASSIPAFLTVLCMPFPFLMIKYGAIIRRKCKYAKEAAELSEQMNGGKP